MTPFRDVEHAWLWYCTMQMERDAGRRPAGHGNGRPCDIDDIAAVFMRLFRSGRITFEQGSVMVTYGFRLTAPDPRYEPRQMQAWNQGLDAMHSALCEKEIVEPRNMRLTGDAG